MPVDEGKVYRIAGPDSAHPMFVWRHEQMVFYLVGNGEETIEKAAKAIGVGLPL